VRHSEALVAHHHDAGARAVGALLVTGLDAEAGVLEVLADVSRRQPGRGVDQVAVHGELVVGVRRVGAVGEEQRQVGRVEDAFGAGRQDAAEAEVVVGAVGLALRGRGRRSERGGDRHEHQQQEGTSPHRAPAREPARRR
jgi:hypothetical protein